MTAATALTKAREVIDAVMPSWVIGTAGRDKLEREIAVALLEAVSFEIRMFGMAATEIKLHDFSRCVTYADELRAEAEKVRKESR